MEEAMDRAQESIHESHGHSQPKAIGTGILVAIMAAVLAITEMAEKSSQNAYLTHHITVSDQWAFYQAKNLRATMRDSEASLLEAQPNAADPAVAEKIKAARDYAARMRDDPKGGEGMKQVAERARREEELREAAFHRYHVYEAVVGALEIAIVLASASIVTRVRSLVFAAGGIGILAGLAGLAVAAGFL
jgi:Domain of unknown function (DUF4337)